MNFIAFYLPQYHAIPENDLIYGKGFTEWNNVKNAKKFFPDHYQPHIPHKTIGWYNLLNDNFLQYQHDLAYSYGIKSFCYYYYNFSGKTLLEKPIIKIRNNKNIKNSYCLCWDHTNWYNNKEGPNSVFLEQTYSLENAIILYHSIAPYFEDPRYITIEGKPLFLIWAPERHPLLQLYAYTLRKLAKEHGFSNLYLAGVESYRGVDPSQMGLDGMVEFAPNWRRENHVSAEGEKPVRIDYDKTLLFMREKEVPTYDRMRCIFPGWDNTPRRGINGIACTGATPRAFANMLEFLIKYTKNHLKDSLQYIFINAWNEWGEGCHIEPDIKYGDSYLKIIQYFYKKYNI